MKNSTKQETKRTNYGFWGIKSLFTAILFLTISSICITPNDANAIVFGVRPNTVSNPAVPTIESYVEAIWISAGTPKVLTMPGYTVQGAQSVTWNSDDLLYYAIITDNSFNRHLATVDPLTGVCAEKGLLPANLSTLAYNSDLGVMYGMSGAGGINPKMLYSINVTNGTATSLGGPYSSGPGLFGAVLAYNFDNMKIYYWTQGVMATIDPVTFVSTPVTLSGIAISEVQGAVYLGGGTFSITDFDFIAGTFNGYLVSAAGVVSFPVALPHQLRGLALYNTLLPVEMSSFVSSTIGNNVNLNWTTASETNNSGFDIERLASQSGSVVNGTWSKVGNVAGNGTATTSNNYSYTDRNVSAGKYNYRLKQIDFNGNFEYFNLSSEVNVGVPSKFSLSQNYPNPFNPSTKISYDLPVDGNVSIKLFDMSGKEVASLVNEVKSAGYYSVNFNASSLSSGIYFYSISAGNFTATKKMMLVK